MRRLLFAAGLAIAVIAAGALAFRYVNSGDNRQTFCAGVGLPTDTHGSSPEEAVAAYVRSRGGDPRDWRRSGKSPAEGVSFEVKGGAASDIGLVSISALEQSPGLWSVDSGCTSLGYVDGP